MDEVIIDSIEKSLLTLNRIYKNKLLLEKLDEICKICISSIKNGGKIIFGGNGGSAADSQHLSAELVGRFKKDRPPISSISLNTNVSSLTAIANDYNYELIFSRQLEALGNSGDLLIAISTSGNSKNIVELVKKAKSMNIISIGLTGEGDSKLSNLCDYIINVPSKETARIQEAHILIGHIICDYIETNLFEN